MKSETKKIYDFLRDMKYIYVNSNWIKQVDSNKVILREIEIETLNRCNGKCAFCPVNVNQPQRKYAKMSEELFKKIISELEVMEYNGKISLYSNNEPFLDERIIEFHKYARKALPDAYFNLYTNGSLLDLDKFKEIVQYLNQLVIDNYNDDLVVNDNMKEIYHFIEQNEEYKKKVHFSFRLENEVLLSRGGQAPNKKNAKPVRSKCLLPFRQMIVRPTGEVSLCCNDALGKVTLGDLNINTIQEIWNSEEYKKIRETMRLYGRKKMQLCKSCDAIIPPPK